MSSNPHEWEIEGPGPGWFDEKTRDRVKTNIKFCTQCGARIEIREGSSDFQHDIRAILETSDDCKESRLIVVRKIMES